MASTPIAAETFETLIPARLDRLPWSRFHWLLVIGLGITWVLDGLEVTLMGAISAVLQRPDVLHFTGAQIGAISSSYLAGAVIGSLIFGHLTDRYGRRKFFFISLAIYLIGVGLTASTLFVARQTAERQVRLQIHEDLHNSVYTFHNVQRQREQSGEQSHRHTPAVARRTNECGGRGPVTSSRRAAPEAVSWWRRHPRRRWQ